KHASGSSTDAPGEPREIPIAQLRRNYLVHSRRLNRMIVASVFTGVAAALAVWLLTAPINRDAVLLNSAMAIVVAVFFVGGMTARIVIGLPQAICPQCGCDWRRESGQNAETWLAWEHCPRCGRGIRCDTAGSAPCPTHPDDVK